MPPNPRAGVPDPGPGMTVDDVRRIAMALPGATERSSYGTPAFRVRDKPFARMREEPGVLVLWLSDQGEKEALIRSSPVTFFTTPHYDGTSLVLVRLVALEEDELTELLTDAWRYRAPRRLVAELDAAREG